MGNDHTAVKQVTIKTPQPPSRMSNKNDSSEPKKKQKAVKREVNITYDPIIVTGHDDSTIRFWTKDVRIKIRNFWYF